MDTSNVFNSIGFQEVGEMFQYKLWTIVRNNFLWWSESSKNDTQNLNGFDGCSFLHNKHFWSLRMSMDSNEKHEAMKEPSKVQMYPPLPGLIWPCPWLHWSNSCEMFNSLTGCTACDHFFYCFSKTRPPDVTSCNIFHSANAWVVSM